MGIMTCAAPWILDRSDHARGRVVVLGLWAALAVAGCGRVEIEEPPWQVVLEELDAALFSVWGRAQDDVWAVGADAGDGPLVLHYDGTSWTRRHTGASGDLWWVSGLGETVWMSGEGGLILRYSYATGDFEVHDTPGTPLLFGIFPVADDDVWAVGGDLPGGGAVAYRFGGAAWSEVEDLPQEALDDPFFKVWGRSIEDLWIVGLGSVALHRGSEGWSSVPVPTGRRLLTVHGGDDVTVAVGGFASGLLVEAQGTGGDLVDVTPLGMAQMSGVWVRPDGDALAAGMLGDLWVRRGGAWHPVPDAPVIDLDYHAAFVDPAGGEWAVGGSILAPPFERGLLVHRGRPVSSEVAGW
jgi:hypothetical protein